MDWLRLWHDMPNDPKWRAIARRSGQKIGDVMAVYMHMMVNASENDPRGTLNGWDDEDVGAALDLDSEAVEAIRNAMQGKVLEGDNLTGWDKRQPKKNDDSRERVRKYREKKAEESKASNDSGDAEKQEKGSGNDDVTPSNAPDTDTDTDTDTEVKDKTPCASGDAPPSAPKQGDLYSEEFNLFWQAYPSKKGKKPAAQKFRAVRKQNPSPEFLNRLIEDVECRARGHEWTKSKGQFIPNAATYLGQERWNDPAPNVSRIQSRHVGFEEKDYSEGLIEGVSDDAANF